jgi:hypothetical protein
MKVENALSYAAGIVICGLIVTLVSFMLALLLRESGGFLADLAEVQAAAVSVMFICTTASTLAFAFRVLSRQPNKASSDVGSKRGKVHREKDAAFPFQPGTRMPDSVGVHDDLASLFRKSKEKAG